jgi:uncharacterized protein DUF5993
MTAILFLLALTAMALAWWGKRHSSIAVALISIVAGVVWFWHHVTSAIKVDL